MGSHHKFRAPGVAAVKKDELVIGEIQREQQM